MTALSITWSRESQGVASCGAASTSTVAHGAFVDGGSRT